jgi:hypothetical protein
LAALSFAGAKEMAGENPQTAAAPRLAQFGVAPFEEEAATKARFAIDPERTEFLAELNDALVAIGSACCGMGHFCVLARARTPRPPPAGARCYFFAHVGGSNDHERADNERAYREMTLPAADPQTLAEIFERARNCTYLEDYLSFLPGYE